MTAKQSFLSSCISFLLFLCCIPALQGHTVNYTTYANRSDLSIGGELTIEDKRRNEPTTSSGNLLYVAKRHIRMQLIYGRETRSDVEGKYWSYRVRYNLYEEGSSTVVMSDTLLVEHLAGGGIYEELDAYLSVSGSVRMEIIAIEASTDGFATLLIDPSGIDNVVPNDIRLELNMEVERYDYLSPNSMPSGLNHVYDTAAHSLLVYWPYVVGAESYELEWAYRDDKGGILVSKIFERATRIETATNHHIISVTYPSGALHYRVRAVGRYIRGVIGEDYSHLKYGVWRYNVGEGNHIVMNTGFEKDKNWQFTTVFAEEGKHKKVISYFDKGLRNRQSQTNLSTDSLTLVSTTHYDVEGRPALNILPVPVSNNNDLFYKPQFNRNTSNTSYNRENFDKALGNACNYNLPDPLSTSEGTFGGAGYYFSDNHATNATATDLYKDYLPDANAYPMTQVRLLNDGTGRVMAQSGVGEFYQLGSERETRYFYDDASATQLQRLFGSNVGAAKYYKRNLVMDANGQMSVSYLDAAGRVVATALTGVAPTNVDSLPSYEDEQIITENLLLNNIIDSLGEKSITISTVMNEIEGNVASFSYSLTGITENFNLLDSTLCLTCQYALKINVLDPCGVPQQINYHGSQLDEINAILPAAGLNCQNPAGLNITFNATMNQIGTYRIFKELCVIDPEAEKYEALLENFFPSILDIQSTIHIDTLSCYVTCEQRCRRELIEGGNPAPTEMDIANCVSGRPECNQSGLLSTGIQNSCDATYNQIIDQVSPGGCYYVQPTWWGSGVDSMQFDFVNGGTGAGNIAETQDSLENPDSWNEAWAAQLAVLHPEYCRYLFCANSNTSRQFDYDFLNMDRWGGPSAPIWPSGAALNILYINVSSGDPMFSPIFGFYPTLKTHGLSSDVLADVISAINAVTGQTIDPNNPNNISMVLLNYMQLELLEDYGRDTSGTLLDLGNYIEHHFSNETDEYKWELFKVMYLGAKERLKRLLLNEWCPIQTDTCAIVEDSELYDIPPPTGDGSNTDDAGQQFIANNDPNFCGALCEFRIEEWAQEISDACPALDSLQLENIKIELLAYCLDSCGVGNPMAHLLTEDLSTNTNLIAASTIISSACSLVMGELPILEQISDSFSLKYTYLLDTSGNKICVSEINIDPCFVEGLQDLNTQLIQSSLCMVGTEVVYIPSSGVSCYDSITINTDGSIRLSRPISEGGSACCAEFELWNVVGDVGVHPCNLDWISAPWADSIITGETCIFLNGIDAATGDTILLEIRCAISEGGFFTGQEIWDETAAAFNCLYSIDTSCVVVPIDTFISIDSVWQWCVDRLIIESSYQATLIRNDSIHRIMQTIINKRDCLDGHVEELKVSYPTREHHYTLYYYDQAGNLIQTVPPEGVDLLPYADFPNGNWSRSREPNHQQRTKYQYNTLGQVVWQSSPDGGATDFKYDYAQRLRASRNAKQQIDTTYSYTRYDAEGRIIEIGELKTSSPSAFDALGNTELNDFNFPSSSNGILTEVTSTNYNVPSTIDNSFPQSHLRGRVAMTSNDVITTRYSYDEHGNVKALQHHLTDLGTEKQRLYYDYDLISGNVKKVAYQPGEYDEFYHRYEYDADNRLTHVYTSSDSLIWEHDARYFYYAHGPMARVELANDKVQGQDYHYSLQGWIKGVNASGYDSHLYEPGRDGNASTGNLNSWTARDAMAYALGYHEQDYQPIGVNVNLGAADTDLWSGVGNNVLSKTFNSGVSIKGLFNGNIAAMISDIRRPSAAGWESLQAMSYQYDQLHRIRKGQSYNVAAGSTGGTITWNSNNNYTSTYAYDANGNLNQLQRNEPSGLMDDLTYTYNEPTGPNQLSYVSDAVSSTTYTTDLDNQLANNYNYDAIGNLIKDESQDVAALEWTVYGKVESVVFNNGNKTEYTYDAAGNRLTKKRIPGPSSVGNEVTTYYLRDASGNVMSVYEKTIDDVESTVIIQQKEVSLYGSARLGQRKFSDRILGSGVNGRHRRVRGERVYELSNHLGNVLSTVSDQKVGVAGVDPWVTEYYEADVKSATDYYAFGLEMPGRQFTSSLGSRYGFNGKEKDGNGEWGSGLSNYDYGFRIYNPSIAKFLSVDPLAPNYPWYTPYQFAGDSPILNIDVDGLEPAPSNEGSLEGQKETTSYDLPEGYIGWPPSEKDYFWHTGNDNLGTKASWYSAYDYQKIIETDLGANVFVRKGSFIEENLGNAEIAFDESVVSPELGAIYSAAYSNQENLAWDLIGTGRIDPVYIEFDAITAASGLPILRRAILAAGRKVTTKFTDDILRKLTEGRKAIGLGLDEELDFFKWSGVLTYKLRAWQKAGLTRVDWGRVSSSDYYFKQSFQESAKNADDIYFNVTKFNPHNTVRETTLYEFNHILGNPSLLNKTTFIRNGTEVFWNGTNFVTR